MYKDKYPSMSGGYCVYCPSNICPFQIIFCNMQDLFTNSLPSKTFTVYEVDFFVFSGTTLSTSRLISLSFPKANYSPTLTPLYS